MHARLFAQIDEASGGRVIAGIGAGWTRAEFEMMGMPFPAASERLRILDEAVAVMRGLWRAAARMLPIQAGSCGESVPGPSLMT